MKFLKLLVFFILCICYSHLYAQKPVIICEKSTHNFHAIPEKDGLVNHTFIIKNRGKAPLVITKVEASCGCTQPVWTKTPIPAGKSGTVKVAFNPKGLLGKFTKTVTVYSNAAKKPLLLYICGEVVPEVKAP